MEEQLLELVASAIAISWITAGITETIKRNTKAEGIAVIIIAVITGIVLLGAVAVIFGYPIPESLLMGIITGFASVGAFEGVDKTKERIKKEEEPNV